MIRAVTALLYLAERKIEEAIARGEFDNLPGAGRPLDLDDEDPLWPEEVRMARRILKNAGYDESGWLGEVGWPAYQRNLRVLWYRRHGGVPGGVPVAQPVEDLGVPVT